VKTPLFETTVTKIQDIAPDVFTLSFPRKEDFRPGQKLAMAIDKEDEPR